MRQQEWVTLFVLAIHIVTGQLDPTCTVDRVAIKGLIELSAFMQHTLPTQQYRAESLMFNLNLALAADYVIDRVNSNSTELAVPGVSYEFSMGGLVNDPSYTTREALLTLPESIWTECSYCISPCNCSNPLILGFVGPSYSSNVEPAASILHHKKIPIISPSATWAQLNNHSKYGSLFRTIASDESQAKAMVEVAKEMNWTYAMLVHSDDEYGRDGKQLLISEGKKHGICFSTLKPIPVNAGQQDFTKIAQDIIQDDAQGVFLFSHTQEAYNIISRLAERNEDQEKFFLASEGVGESPELLDLSQLSNQNGADKRIRMVVISNTYEQAGLSSFIEYKRSRLQQLERKASASELDHILIKFKDSCRDMTDCSEDSLIQMLDGSRAMIDATVALLSSFQQAHQQLCGNSSGLCEELMSSDELYEHLLGNLYAASIQTRIDDYMASVRFDSDGEIRMGSKSMYRLSVLRLTSSSGHGEYVEVGQYFDEAGNRTGAGWNYTKLSLLRQEALTSHCTHGCSICRDQRRKYIFREGASPYIIAGSGAVSSNENGDSCSAGSINPNGFMYMETFYFAVERIKLLTSIDFSTLFMDTCYSKLETHITLSTMFNSSTNAILTTADGSFKRVPISYFVVFLGDPTSDISLVLQNYLGLFDVPQLSYGGSTTWLNDRMRYPKFLRVTPPDDEQVKLMLQITKEIGLKKVGLVYQWDSAYGQNGGKLIMDQAREMNVCVSYTASFSRDTDSVDRVARQLDQKSRNNELPLAILLFVDRNSIPGFLSKLQTRVNYWSPRGHFFIASDTWGSLRDFIDGTVNVVNGSLTVSYSDKNITWIDKEKGIDYFKQYLGRQTPENNFDNPLFMQYWQEHFHCFIQGSYTSSSDTQCDLSERLYNSASSHSSNLLTADTYSKNMVIAALKVAYAVRDLQDELNCLGSSSTQAMCKEMFGIAENRERFFELLKKVEIPRQFWSRKRDYQPLNENGDGKANFIVKNIVHNGRNMDYKEVYSMENGQLIKGESEPIFYKGGRPWVMVDEECQPCSCLNLPANKTSTHEEHDDHYTLTCLVITILVIVLTFFLCSTVSFLWSQRIIRNVMNRVTEIQKQQSTGAMKKMTTKDTLSSNGTTTNRILPNPPLVGSEDGYIPLHDIQLGSSSQSKNPIPQQNIKTPSNGVQATTRTGGQMDDYELVLTFDPYTAMRLLPKQPGPSTDTSSTSDSRTKTSSTNRSDIPVSTTSDNHEIESQESTLSLSNLALGRDSEVVV